MFRKQGSAFTFFVLLSLATSATAAPSKKAPTFGDLSEDILSCLQELDPVHATEMGIHTFDSKLADYSTASIKSFTSRLKQFETRLHKVKVAELRPHEQINHKLLKGNVDIALLDLNQIEWYRRSPQLYVDQAVNGIYFLMLSQHAPLSEKLPSILGRMRGVSTLLAQAQKNLGKQPKVSIDAAKESLESGMEFYREVAGELMRQFPARANEILQVSTAARGAMTNFEGHLAALEPGSEKGFAIGKVNFDYKLAHEYFLQFDADSLLHIGEGLLATAQKQYKEFESYVELNHQNGQDSVFIPATFTRQDLLDYYGWEVNQVKALLKLNDIVRVPDDIAPVTVIQTPPFLHTMISGIAYQPAGPFDKIHQGYFYVRPIPDSIDRTQLDARYRYVHRRGFRGSVVHEAYPGHHLQMQLAAHNSDPVRKWQMNTMMIEGWALYCEEMMYHSGLFGREDPSQWLGILGGIRFRAARIVADVKLHTGEFTYDDCVEWMTKTLEVETSAGEEYIRKEVRRYTISPTVQMSYLMGKREIERLKEAVSKREGSNFSERAFFDRLLGEGSIPPQLMWDALNLTTDSSAVSKP